MVFPSLFEGFGLPVLESMACGTPVACSDRGAVAEIAGNAALQFDPTDVEALAGAITRVVADEDLRRTLRTAGLARAQFFTWSACAAAHLDVYRVALAQAT
jgi:glycosyltransferase involved in cell wall biosynthesis